MCYVGFGTLLSMWDDVGLEMKVVVEVVSLSNEIILYCQSVEECITGELAHLRVLRFGMPDSNTPYVRCKE